MLVERALETRFAYVPQLEYERFTPKQKRILLTMAFQGLRHPAQIAKALRYHHVHHITRELRTLEDLGFLVRKNRGEYQIYSRVFNRWLARKAEGYGYSVT